MDPNPPKFNTYGIELPNRRALGVRTGWDNSMRACYAASCSQSEISLRQARITVGR
jgi:hypothetical protein